MSQDDDKRPRPVTRWIAVGGIAVGALVALAVVTFAVLNLSSGKPAPPLYTDDDLPDAPPEATNGWAQLRDAPMAHAGPSSDLRKFVLLATDAATAETPEQLISRAPTLNAASRRSVADCVGFFEQPRFADTCPANFDVRCPTLEVFQCHNLVTFEVVRRLGDGERAGSLALAKDLLRSSLDHASTAHTLIGQSVAQSDLETTLGLVRALRGWVEPDDAAPLVNLIRAHAPSPPPRQLALMGEYLLMIDALERLADGNDEDVPTFLLDVGETRETIDEAFRQAAAGGGLTIDDPRESRLWWFDNAPGKLLLSSWAPSATAFARLESRIAANDAAMTALLRP